MPYTNSSWLLYEKLCVLFFKKLFFFDNFKFVSLFTIFFHKPVFHIGSSTNAEKTIFIFYDVKKKSNKMHKHNVYIYTLNYFPVQ